MHHQRLLISLTAATLAVSACSSSVSSQPHDGWELVGQKLSGDWPALRVAKSGDTALSVVLIVEGGCPDGGPATPSFAGFAVSGDTIEAVVSRTPIPSDHCFVYAGKEFDVLLDLRSVPANARTMILGGQACVPGDDICTAVSAPLPTEGLATPSP